MACLDIIVAHYPALATVHMHMISRHTRVLCTALLLLLLLLQRVVRELVEGSIGPRQFPRAVQAVAALRQAAVQQGRPAAFNAYLDQVG
jgi:hypothetical protein